MVNIDFLCRGGLSVTFVDLSTLLGVAGSSLESSDVSSSFLVVLVVVFSSRASFFQSLLCGPDAYHGCSGFDVLYLCLFGKIRSRMLDLTKLNLYCFGLVSIPSLLSALRVVLWLCDEDASSFVDFFCRHPPLLLLLLRHEAFA